MNSKIVLLLGVLFFNQHALSMTDLKDGEQTTHDRKKEEGKIPAEYTATAKVFLALYNFEQNTAFTKRFVQEHMQECITLCDQALTSGTPSDRLLYFMYPRKDFNRGALITYKDGDDASHVQALVYAFLRLSMNKFYEFSTKLFNAACEQEAACDLQKDCKDISEEERVAWTQQKGTGLLTIIINVTKKLAQAVLAQLELIQ